MPTCSYPSTPPLISRHSYTRVLFFRRRHPVRSIDRRVLISRRVSAHLCRLAFFDFFPFFYFFFIFPVPSVIFESCFLTNTRQGRKERLQCACVYSSGTNWLVFSCLMLLFFFLPPRCNIYPSLEYGYNIVFVFFLDALPLLFLLLLVVYIIFFPHTYSSCAHFNWIDILPENRNLNI